MMNRKKLVDWMSKEQLFYCYSCEKTAPPKTTHKDGMFLGKPTVYSTDHCSLCGNTGGTIRKFTCCPYCGSKDISEHKGDLQRGSCNKCGDTWYDSQHYCD